MYNLFWNLYKSIGNKRTHFFAFGIVLIVVLLWVASSLKFDEDISKLIPSNLKNEKLILNKKVLTVGNTISDIIKKNTPLIKKNNMNISNNFISIKSLGKKNEIN